MIDSLKQDSFKTDIVITLIFCIFWLLFSFQHGFSNSPDSYYRGIIGKSIVEGHPYYVNIKQGWLYDFGLNHQETTHSPLLPVLYSIFFLFFGYKIIIANIIVNISAGLFILPLLRLSRQLFKTPFYGFIVYLLCAFNIKNDFLFEVFSGLSIPTTLMFLAFFLYFVFMMLSSPKRIYFWGSIISIVCFFYIRPGEQVIFVWLMIFSLIGGKYLLEKEHFRKVRSMWLTSFLFVVPWLIRNVILFRQPFFSPHSTPALWTDRGYDYWSYHESIPYPTAATYFENHSILDFLHKIFIKGVGNYLFIFNQTLDGFLWLYVAIFILSLFVILRTENDKIKKFFFLIIPIIFIGYSVIYSIVSVLDKRYMMLPYFLMFFCIVSGLYYIFPHIDGRKKLFYRFLLVAITIFLIRDFGLNNKLTFSFSSSDAFNSNDPTIRGLIKKLNKNDVILGPFADVQRLSFATGLSFIEEPDNLKELNDPVAFFKKYKIKYSLVDVSHLLPPEYIKNVEMAGNKPLFIIDTENTAGSSLENNFQDLNIYEDSKIKKSISVGIANRMVFIDDFHGDSPDDLSIFMDLNVKKIISNGDYFSNKEKLFQCGLLVLRYGMGKEEFSDAERVVVKKYIRNGGRVLLLCPAWVWVTYEKKEIERLPGYEIAKLFDIVLTTDYANPPFSQILYAKISDLEKMNSSYSNIIYRGNAKPVIMGKDNSALAVSAENHSSKIIVWSHNNLLNPELLNKPGGKEFVRQIFNWLLL